MKEQASEPLQGELIMYYPNDSIHIAVTMINDTVWLNRAQLALLFDRDIKTIGKHIAHALKEELSNISVVAKFATTASDGKNYKVEFYNLDMILSVGYRVKSERGVQFRIWANKILKEYLLKGYAIHSNFQKLENDVNYLKQKAEEFDVHIKTTLPPHEGIFYDGQIFDAYAFVSNIIKTVKISIVLIDNYIDESVLLLLSKRESKVLAQIYTGTISKQLQLDIEKYNSQYSPIEIIQFKKSHDRFLIIDSQEVFHIGASLKDLGKKWFAFSKMQAKHIFKSLEE